jgi:ABC-2 type transport system ATP-binding protein
MIGPVSDADRYADRGDVVHATRGGTQAQLLVTSDQDSEPVPPGWEAHPVSLEELTMAYLREPDVNALTRVARTQNHPAPEASK